MKRLISVILFFFSMCCYAGDSIRYYAATSFSYKKVVNGNGQTGLNGKTQE